MGQLEGPGPKTADLRQADSGGVGQGRLLEVVGGPLNQGHMRANGKVQVTEAKGCPGGGKTLVVERHSKVTVKGPKLRRLSAW